MSSGRPKCGLLYDCLCPRCGERHKSQIACEDNGPGVEWAGRGIPRVFCRACKLRMGWYYGGDCPRLEYDLIERGRL